MTSRLAAKRIPIVEEEYFIASDLGRAFEREGAIVVGPVGDVDEKLRLLEAQATDAAVLDVNFEGAMSYAAADRLRECAIPFVVLTGYDEWALPPDYRDVPRSAKPCLIDAVVARAGSLLAAELVA